MPLLDMERASSLCLSALRRTAACTCAGRVVPFDAILMSILIEERRAARELSRRVEELERRRSRNTQEGEDPR